jgi:hypothetical protein
MGKQDIVEKKKKIYAASPSNVCVLYNNGQHDANLHTVGALKLMRAQ